MSLCMACPIKKDEKPRKDGSLRGFFGQSTKLVGGFEADLCCECRNDWTEFVRAAPEYRRLREIDLTLNAAYGKGAATTHSEDALRGLERERIEVQDRLYEIGKTWHAARVATAAGPVSLVAGQEGKTC